MEQRELEQIDYINTRMNNDYEHVMKIMGEYHNRLLENASESSLTEVLLYFGEIAQKMIDTQIAYNDVCCSDRSYAEHTIERLEEKKETLLNALKNDYEMGKSR